MPMQERLARRSASAGTVALGVRPEALSNTAYVAAPSGATVVPMQVKLTELMGDHQYVYLAQPGAGGVRTQKCDPPHPLATGAVVCNAIDTARAHVFDGEGEFAANVTLPKGVVRQ